MRWPEVVQKYFKKNEKNACQGANRLLILTPKPNQTPMEKLMIRTVNIKTGLLRAALVAGVGCASLFSASLYAQAPATEATAERIIVTGSNIPTAEEVLASPDRKSVV